MKTKIESLITHYEGFIKTTQKKLLSDAVMPMEIRNAEKVKLVMMEDFINKLQDCLK